MAQRMVSIHANTTGTAAGGGASEALVTVSTMLPTSFFFFRFVSIGRFARAVLKGEGG